MTILHHTAILILVAVIAFPVALIMLAQLAALSKRPCLRKTEWVDLYMICQRLPPQHDAPYSAGLAHFSRGVSGSGTGSSVTWREQGSRLTLGFRLTAGIGTGPAFPVPARPGGAR